MIEIKQISHLDNSSTALEPDLHGLTVFLSPYHQRAWPCASHACTELKPPLHLGDEVKRRDRLKVGLLEVMMMYKSETATGSSHSCIMHANTCV